MAYALHIRRRNAADADRQISIEEWRDYLDSDPEFRRIDTVEGTNPVTGSKISIPGNEMAVWIGLGEPDPVFNYSEGHIDVNFRGRNQAAIEKMKLIAATFEAKVIGDEEEEY